MVSFFKMSRFGILLHASRFGTIRRFGRLAIRAIRDSDNPFGNTIVPVLPVGSAGAPLRCRRPTSTPPNAWRCTASGGDVCDESVNRVLELRMAPQQPRNPTPAAAAGCGEFGSDRIRTRPSGEEGDAPRHCRQAGEGGPRERRMLRPAPSGAVRHSAGRWLPANEDPNSDRARAGLCDREPCQRLRLAPAMQGESEWGGAERRGPSICTSVDEAGVTVEIRMLNRFP